MHTEHGQFKKGLLEMVILILIGKKEMYGYEIVQLISPVMDVHEGTVYPLLKRMADEKLFEVYYKESHDGPIRKYYRLTDAGREKKELMWNEWVEFTHRVTAMLKSV